MNTNIWTKILCGIDIHKDCERIVEFDIHDPALTAIIHKCNLCGKRMLKLKHMPTKIITYDVSDCRHLAAKWIRVKDNNVTKLGKMS